jgi:hypothetical protein
MSLKLNSSGGGSVTLQEPTTASNVTLNLPAADGTVVYENASGNVGIGTSSPAYKFDVNGIIRGRSDQYFGWVSGSQAGVWWSQANYAVPAFQGLTSAGNVGDIVMQPGGGNLLVGTTTASAKFVVNGVGGTSGMGFRFTGWGSGIGAAGTFESANTSNADVIYFNTSAANVGKISITSTATSYTTSSDYRLKHDVAPMQNALATVAQLNPVTYKWNADNSESQGFIAHELQAVVPDCVTGEKDAVDAEGNPVYQGIDTSFLVATLTAAIQELKAEVDSLRAQVEAQ